MTRPIERPCTSWRWEDYLKDRLSNTEQAKFEEHLSVCVDCQNEIQNQAAQPELWEHAVAMLGRANEASVNPSANPLANPSILANPLMPDAPSDEDRDDGFRSRQVQCVLESLAPTDDPEMLGRLDDYEIVGVVGVGGMGVVLKGYDRSLRRIVAIKIMAPHLAGSGSARTRFQREARAAAAITHDNVIDIYGVSEANGLPYLVMPYARGPSLQQRIDEGGPLSVPEVLRIGRQIAAGLAAAHEQGVVHRDIKPANILLNDGIERLLITDFGVARAMDDASMTRTGLIAGTPQYMSPEQARGEAVDFRSDLFSMGSILYTACTGRPPFRSEAAYGILRRITDADPRRIRDINPEIPDWLVRIIERLMAKHPADRFEHAEEVARLLDGCLAHWQQPTQVPLPPSIVSLARMDSPDSPSKHRPRIEPTSSRQRHFSSKAIGVTVTLLLLAGLAVVDWSMILPVTNHSQALGVVNSAPNPNQHAPRELTIQAADSGIIVRWGDGIAKGARVKQGDLIAKVGPLGSSEQGGLETQLAAATHQGEVLQDQIDTAESNLKNIGNLRATIESQMKSYEQMQQQTDESSAQLVAAAENQLEAARQQVAEEEAVRDQAMIEFKRQQSLFQDKITSQLKFQSSEAKLRQTQAKVAQAELAVESAEANLAAKKQEAVAQRQKAQDDLVDSKKSIVTIENDEAKAAIQIHKIKFELANNQSTVERMEAELRRSNSYEVRAPFDGYVTEVTNRQLLKEGDFLCRLKAATPPAPDPDREPDQASVATMAPSSDQTTTPNDLTWAVSQDYSIPNHFGPNLLGPNLFAPVSDLKRRLRESRDEMKVLQSELKMVEKNDQLVMQDIARIKAEIVQTEEQAKSEDSSAAGRFENKLSSLASQLESLEDIVASRAIRITELLKARELPSQVLAEAESERDTIIGLLESQLSAARTQFKLQSDRVALVRQAVALGDQDRSDLINAEEQLAPTQGRVEQLELLLEMYRSLGLEKPVS